MRRAAMLENGFFGVLDRELEVVQATSLHTPEEIQFIPDIRQWRRIHAHFLIRDGQTRRLPRPAFQKVRDQHRHAPVWYEADDNSEGDRQESKHDSNRPHGARLTLLGNRECRTADKDDQHLPTTHDGADADEEPVMRQALKYVKAVIQATVTENAWLVI